MPYSPEHFCLSMNDAVIANDLHSALDLFKSWQASHCYHPTTQRVYDAHTGTYRVIQVPCGKCYHCRESHINEWVTRMYAHLEDFKNAYFITLTYRSFANADYDVNRLMMSKLSQAVWHQDSFNETKHYAYSPCLLVKSHYQNFLKRLRKNTGLNDITYTLCGEYGKTYGRPHFHAILFTNGELSADDIRRAWSVALFKHNTKGWTYKTSQKKDGQSYYFPIGRIDFNDLVKNGTLNTTCKIKVDNNIFGAERCFSYVCKYVCKQDSYNKSRLLIAYKNLWSTTPYCQVLNNDIPESQLHDFLKSRGYSTDNNINRLFINHYEKFIPIFGEHLFTQNLSRSIDLAAKYFYHFVNSTGPNDSHVFELFPSDFKDFATKFSPFVEFSRGTPIGSVFAKTHISEFAQGVFCKPALQDKSYVLPRYFFTKAQEYVYGLRKVRKTMSSTSYVLSLLPDLYKFLSSNDWAKDSVYVHNLDFKGSGEISQLLRSQCSFYDKYRGEHILLRRCFLTGDVYAESYKYIRSTCNYVLVRSIPIHHWCAEWLSRLSANYERYNLSLQRSKRSIQLTERAFLLATELGFDLDTERSNFENEQEVWLTHHQVIYDETHLSAE